jgi:hypothetical protein
MASEIIHFRIFLSLLTDRLLAAKVRYNFENYLNFCGFGEL